MPAQPDGSGGGHDELSAAVAGLAAENASLRAQLTRRHLIDLATGILVIQLGTSPAEATEHLLRLADATGVSTEDLAADIVNSAAGSVAVTPAPASPGDGDVRAEARRMRRVVTAAEGYDTVGGAAATLLEGGLRPLGAESLWLWRTEAGSLRLAGHAGVSAAEAVRWQWIPPGAPAPLRQVLTEGSPVWLPSGPPEDVLLPGPGTDAARALLPLRLKGATVGAALVVWPGPVELDATLRRVLTDLLDVAARVLSGTESTPSPSPLLDDLLDALAHPAMVLSRDPDTRKLSVEYLNPPASETLGGGHQSMGQPLEVAFPRHHAELALLSLRAHEGTSLQRAARLPSENTPSAPAPLLDVRVLPVGPGRTVVLWHTSSDRRLSATRAVGHLQGVGPFEDDVIAGTSSWSEGAYGILGVDPGSAPIPLAELRVRVHPADAGEFDGLLCALTERRRGAVTVVRVTRDDGGLRHVRVAAEPLLDEGVLTGITGVYQDVSTGFHTEAALSATFDQLTAVQAQAALRHQLALQLQHAIVPEMPALQRLPGLQATARYRPAVQEYRVGGDWYDVLPLPDGKVLVAVGDIAGHGIDSATGMVALRNALRGLAFTGHTPGRLMEWLNEVTVHTQGHPTATAVCALYDPADRTLCWASAGHLPLLLLREGRARLIDTPRNILLGAVPTAAYHETTTQLMPGDTLLLYTDGLIERRHDALDEGLETLRRAAEELSGCEAEEQADRLLSAATGDTDDDTSLIAIHIS
ncbi:SpoIIE family protein phosphatase [Streptomyces sp. NBC_00829]|uniref:SpoIIE family protein phosphatase n=1 Tax=Streptomyces sp. NBC_00829 TaxID=2903679 RepID=UPI00386A200A|nr:SpoIIE family protein phosphatase [Streptomyces sp. NBC_00829]